MMRLRRQLQCFFFAHKLRYEKRWNGPQLKCDRCGNPYGETLADRYRQFQRWIETQRKRLTNNEDDIPF
jgi:hypothetical protein